MRYRTLLPVLGLLLGASACSSRQPGENPRAQAQVSTVLVQNQAWLDMNVYVQSVGIGARTRLGTVNGTSNTTLRIPAGIVGAGRTVRFLVDPIGSQRTATSFEINVRPGEQVTITIPSSVGR